MKTNIIVTLTCLASLAFLNSCVAVVDPVPSTTTQATTTTSAQTDPYTGDTVYSRTTTTAR